MCSEFAFQKTAKRVKMIRSLIREVSGFAPYERRAMEILKVFFFFFKIPLYSLLIIIGYVIFTARRCYK